jgi:y4mF family transcriptional regulator
MESDLTKAFGTLIRQKRREQGLTQMELAMVSGTGTRFIVDLEAGKSSCQLGKALAVAKILRVKFPAADNPGAGGSHAQH